MTAFEIIPNNPAAKKIEILTKREQQILTFLNAGKLNKEIGYELSISIETVKKHTKNIYKKLEVRNRVEAVLYAINY